MQAFVLKTAKITCHSITVWYSKMKIKLRHKNEISCYVFTCQVCSAAEFLKTYIFVSTCEWSSDTELLISKSDGKYIYGNLAVSV
jgi:hypothetical protein